MNNLNTQVAGEYKLVAVQPDGTERILANWFPNLITNAGLNRMGTASDYTNNCQVGTGSTTPQFTDTALVSSLAAQSSVTTTSTSEATAPLYQRTITKRFRFNTGVATGNLTEVGVGWATTGSLFSRALILDGSGNPTTVTVLSTETLDVYYRLTIYPYINDITGTIELGGEEYSYTMRAASLDTLLGVTSSASTVNSSLASGFAGNGVLSAINTRPTNTNSYSFDPGIVPAAYSNNSYQRTGTLTFGLNRS